MKHCINLLTLFRPKGHQRAFHFAIFWLIICGSVELKKNFFWGHGSAVLLMISPCTDLNMEFLRLWSREI